MAERTPSVDEVRLIITTGLPDQTIAAIITDAALIVADCVEDLEDEQAKAIVKYVAADIISSVVTSGGAGARTAKALGDASESWNASGAEFGKSAYWARALMLDPNGCLERLGRKRATIEPL